MTAKNSQLRIQSTVVQHANGKYAPVIHYSDGTPIPMPDVVFDTMEEAMQAGSRLLTELSKRLQKEPGFSAHRPGEPHGFSLVSPLELKQLDIAKPEGTTPIEELHGYLSMQEHVLGIVGIDKYDGDFSYVVLGRRKDTQPYRAIDLGVSFATLEAAQDELFRKMKRAVRKKSWRKA